MPSFSHHMCYYYYCYTFCYRTLLLFARGFTCRRLLTGYGVSRHRRGFQPARPVFGLEICERQLGDIQRTVWSGS